MRSDGNILGVSWDSLWDPAERPHCSQWLRARRAQHRPARLPMAVRDPAALGVTKAEVCQL